MRTRGLLAVLTICAASMGCSGYFRSIERNFTILPLQGFEESRLKHRNHDLAEEAWRHVTETSPNVYSSEFGDGFVDGYADYLNQGGNCDPPAVPPFRYRTLKYQTPEGVAAINQWFEGFRQGSLMAKASGLRELQLVQLSAPPINAVEPSYNQPIALPPTPEQPPVPPRQLPPEPIPVPIK
jgi:hypothetical protein